MQELERLYAAKERTYFADSRNDIQAVVEGFGLLVLDIGCSDGSLGAALLASGKAGAVDGVEMNPDAAFVARERLTSVYTGRVESALDVLADNKYDLLIIGDVLEHLIDPWSVGEALAKKLKMGGSAIVSVPNVQSFEVIWPLLCGRWSYQRDGILDQTHLRFFTKATFNDLLTQSGLKVETIVACFSGRRYSYTSQLSLGILEPFLAQRWLAVTKRM